MEWLPTVVSIVSPVGMLIFTYFAFVRNKSKDTQEHVRTDATVLSDIGYIKSNTDEIKAEQKEQRKINLEMFTRLTAVEASAKQAHRRLDSMEGRQERD